MAPIRKFDWKKYEADLETCLEKAFRQAMEQFANEKYYGAALHTFYCERGNRIDLPCLAVNTEEEVMQHPC